MKQKCLLAKTFLQGRQLRRSCKAQGGAAAKAYEVRLSALIIPQFHCASGTICGKAAER